MNNSQLQIKKKKKLKHREKIQIRYRAEMESFYYLFLTSQPKPNEVNTQRIYPASSAIPKVRASETIYIPAPQRNFEIKNMEGHEHLWGWSCFGPILDKKLLKRAFLSIENELRKTSRLSPKIVTENRPLFCQKGFAFSI